MERTWTAQTGTRWPLAKKKKTRQKAIEKDARKKSPNDVARVGTAYGEGGGN